MRWISALTTLVALAAAGPAEARCRVVLEKGEHRLGRTAEGWKLCGRGVTFPPTGRPVALNTHGRAVTVRFRNDSRTIITWVGVGDDGPIMRDVVLTRGERYVRQVLREDELYVAVGGRRPHIRRVRTTPGGVIDRSRGLVPRSLRSVDGSVRWRVGDDVRRLTPDGVDIPPSDCRVPAYATAPHRAPDAVAYELRLGVSDFRGKVFGCFGAGPPRAVAETSNDLILESARSLVLGGPFALFSRRRFWKSAEEQLVTVDLRTGQETARALLKGGFMEAAVSASGAFAFSQRIAERQEIVTARGETVETLDSGPSVDGRSLNLDGSTLSWISGGQRRTAELP